MRKLRLHKIEDFPFWVTDQDPVLKFPSSSLTGNIQSVSGKIEMEIIRCFWLFSRSFVDKMKTDESDGQIRFAQLWDETYQFHDFSELEVF